MLINKILDNKKSIANFKNGFLYFGGSIIQLAIGIVTQPIFSRYLTAEDFATIGYYSAIGQFFFPLFNLSLTSYYFVHYYKNSDQQNKELATFILSFLTVVNSVSFVAGHFIILAYFRLFNVNFALIPFATLTLATLFLNVYRTFYLVDCRINKKGWKYFAIMGSSVLLTASFSLIFVAVYKGGAAGKMLGPVVSQFIVLAFLIYSFSKNGISLINGIGTKSNIKSALKFSYPLILAGYVYYPIQNIDRIFLERLGNYHEFGYYNIGVMMSGLLDTMAIAISQGFEPDMYKYYETKSKKKYFKISLIYIVGLLLAILLFILFSKSIVGYLTANRFTKAALYANINVIAILFFRSSGIFQTILTAARRTKELLYINIITGVLSIFIFYIMIHSYSFMGASFGKIIVGFILLLTSVGYYLYQRRIGNLNF